MGDIPRFEQGMAPSYTKQQLRELQRRQRRQKQRGVLSSEPLQKRQTWFLLPCDLNVLMTISLLSGDSFFQKRVSLEGYDSFFPKTSVDSSFLERTLLHKQICRDFLEQNQRVRWILKPFLMKWLVKRCKKVNEIDFITLSPIEYPVVSIHFQMRTSYTFEALSIANDIHKKLLHHDGQIPVPVCPRNPYTNNEFTLSEILDIYRQCKRYGKMSWAFESFIKAGMNIGRFLEYQRKPLRIHAIRSILRDTTDWDGNDLLLNFIECHHDEHESPFKKRLYRWCLLHMPEEPRLKSWRRLCFQYYEKDILAEDNDQRDCLFYSVKAMTGELCAPPYELETKMKFIQTVR